MAGAVQEMASGLGQRLPLSQLGLAGPAPSVSSARGAMPGGLDKKAAVFSGLERVLKQAASTLKDEGNNKSLRMANELEAMAVKVNRMMLEHQQEVAPAQGGGSGSAPTQFPQIDAQGVANG